MSDLKVGDKIKDNDPRMPDRILMIRRFEVDRVVATMEDAGRSGETRVSVSRIFTDGKPRRTGWSRIDA
jgi:hypothetical protein